MNIKHILLAAIVGVAALTSCDKVSPSGVLMAGTAVEDRVKMSELYYRQYLSEYKLNTEMMLDTDEGYSFLVGADSHLVDDPGRMDEMLKIGLDNDDLLYAHLGDIADTKPEYYIRLDSLLNEAKIRYVQKYFVVDEKGLWRYKKYVETGQYTEDFQGLTFDEIHFPFFPVVGNHDLTHNGWAMWCSLFHSSFYDFDVVVDYNEKTDEFLFDHFIFLDTASGTLGKRQIDLIEQGLLDGENKYRYTFIFSHTNIFRPSANQFASTFAREETFYLLDQFEEWNASIVFCGHVHKFDERDYNLVTYLTLDSMSERNSPDPGDYLIRVKVSKEGVLTWEKVHMNYVAKK